MTPQRQFHNPGHWASVVNNPYWRIIHSKKKKSCKPYIKVSYTIAEWMDATKGIIWTLKTEDNRAVQKKLASKHENKSQIIKETEKRTESQCQEQRIRYKCDLIQKWSFLVARSVKILPAMLGDPGSIPGLGRSPGEGNGNPLNILAWRIPWTEEPGEPTVHGVTKSQTGLSD